MTTTQERVEHDRKVQRARGIRLVDKTLSSTLQDVLRQCWLCEDTLKLSRVGPAPSRHTHMAQQLVPLPPPTAPPQTPPPSTPMTPAPPRQRAVSARTERFTDKDDEPHLRSFKHHPTAWWRAWPPEAPTDAQQIPPSVSTERQSIAPQRFVPPVALKEHLLLTGKDQGTRLLKHEVGKEEMEAIMLKLHTEALMSMVSVKGGRLERAIQKGKLPPLIDTTGYYPLVPVEVDRADPTFALCAYTRSVAMCPRGYKCPFVHSTNRHRENFRRAILKIHTRVAWAITFTVPTFPPREQIFDVPNSVTKHRWEDEQMRFMPQWTVERPTRADPGSFCLGVALELRRTGRLVKRLELRRCALSSFTGTQLTSSLFTCVYLRELCLSYCDLTDITIGFVSEFIDSHPTLLNLELPFNNIGPEGVARLCEGIAACSSLRSLSLHGNPVGDQGAVYLSRLLMSHTLRNLNLSSTMLADEGWGVIARTLSSNKSLTILNLDGTTPSLTGCLHLFHSLKLNTTLVDISLRYIKATTRCYLENLADVMEKNAQKRKKALTNQFRMMGRERKLGLSPNAQGAKLRYKRKRMSMLVPEPRRKSVSPPPLSGSKKLGAALLGVI